MSEKEGERVGGREGGREREGGGERGREGGGEREREREEREREVLLNLYLVTEVTGDIEKNILNNFSKKLILCNLCV